VISALNNAGGFCSEKLGRGYGCPFQYQFSQLSFIGIAMSGHMAAGKIARITASKRAIV